MIMRHLIITAAISALSLVAPLSLAETTGTQTQSSENINTPQVPQASPPSKGKLEDIKQVEIDLVVFSAARGDINAVKSYINKVKEIKGALNIQRTQDKRTILMGASRTGKEDVVKLLLDAGADTTLKDFQGKTAFDLATENNFPAIATMIKDAETKKTH